VQAGGGTGIGRVAGCEFNEDWLLFRGERIRMSWGRSMGDSDHETPWAGKLGRRRGEKDAVPGLGQMYSDG
jgi:hypothetical protein